MANEAGNFQGIRVRLLGAEKALESMNGRQASVLAQLYEASTDIGVMVVRTAKEVLASRPKPISYDSRIPQRVGSSRLSRAIVFMAERVTWGARTIVGVLAIVPYGRIQERGGVTPPHVIEPRSKQALRWVSGNFIGPVRLTGKGAISRKQASGISFAKRVNHPGSRIPGQPYIEPGIRMNLPAIRDRWVQAVSTGLKSGS